MGDHTGGRCIMLSTAVFVPRTTQWVILWCAVKEHKIVSRRWLAKTLGRERVRCGEISLWCNDVKRSTTSGEFEYVFFYSVNVVMILLGNWYNADDIADDQNPKEQNQLISPTPTTICRKWIIYLNGGETNSRGWAVFPQKHSIFAKSDFSLVPYPNCQTGSSVVKLVSGTRWTQSYG